MNQNKHYGLKHFKKKDFRLALTYFSLALQEKPEDEELATYISLSNLALKREEEALNLFDFYRASLKNKDFKDTNIQQIIDSLEVGIDGLDEFLQSKELENFLLEEKGITYEDFLLLVEQRGDFRLAFEDIMFSTRVLISKKEDFLHFLNLLVENDFTQMALNYLESATNMFPTEASLQDIAKKVQSKLS